MSKLTLHHITPHSKFIKNEENPIFEVELHTTTVLKDIEFVVQYIGSVDTDIYDQLLADFVIQTMPAGNVKFDLKCNPIKYNEGFTFGMTSILIIGKYKEEEFLRVGFFVRVGYEDIPFELLCTIVDDDFDNKGDKIYEKDEEDEEKCSQSSFLDEEQNSFCNENEKNDSDCLENKTNNEENSISSQKSANEFISNSILSQSPKKELDDQNITLCEKNENSHIEEKTEDNITDANPSKNSSIDNLINDEIRRRELANQIVWPDYKQIEDNDKIFTLGHVFDKKKITVEICEKPLVTTFKINWDEKIEIKESNSDNSAESNKEDQQSNNKRWKRH